MVHQKTLGTQVLRFLLRRAKWLDIFTLQSTHVLPCINDYLVITAANIDGYLVLTVGENIGDATWLITVFLWQLVKTTKCDGRATMQLRRKGALRKKTKQCFHNCRQTFFRRSPSLHDYNDSAALAGRPIHFCHPFFSAANQEF